MLSPRSERIARHRFGDWQHFRPSVASESGAIGRERCARRVGGVRGCRALFGLSAEEGYRFVIGFVRKVLYEEFPSTKRASLHGQLPPRLEAQHAQNIDAHAGDIALHLLATREGDAIEQALELAELGASHSSRAQDFQRRSNNAFNRSGGARSIPSFR